jgi:hypothetical protein
MSDQAKAINFGEIVKEMAKTEKNKIGKNAIAIIGGVIDLQAESESIFEQEQLAPEIKQSAEEKISQFIAAWRPVFDEKSIAIWETIDRIEMPMVKAIPSEYGELMRARFFGENGDLSLRRDGNGLYWHFIGTPRNRNDFPKIKNICRFWDEQEKLPEAERVEELRLQENVEALLWGERVKGKNFWREDRVGAIDLVYPTIQNLNGRVKLLYDVYWHNGQPAFVWFKKLVEAPSTQEQNEDKKND